MKEEKRKAPKLRFPGFEGDWEQRKLGDISKRVIVGLATSVTPYYRKEGVPILRNLNIKENQLDDTDILFLDKSYANSQASKQIHTGDVLTVHTGYIGTSCVVPEKYDNCLTFTTLITTTNEKIVNGEFLSQYLNSEIGMSSVQAVTTQGGRQNLNTNDFVKVIIHYPSLQEQERIIRLLTYLDNLITLHQRKLDQIKEYKKGMLQKMFPKKGETVPEVRFPGFEGDWEERKLSDICIRIQGNDGNMNLPTLTISAGEGWLDQRDRFNKNIAGKEQKNYTLLKKGQLSYNHGNSKLAKYGVVFVLRKYEKALVPRVYHSFDVNGMASPGFIEYMFATKIPDLELGKLVSSGARMDGLLNINYDDFVGIKITVPSFKEQIAISTFLECLDKAIALHQRKLDHLKEYKKGLLQQMFV